MLANRLDASESLSRDFRYRVEVLSDDATIALKDVTGKMATVELVREDGSLRYFNGYVFEFRFVKTDGGFAFYEMLLGPWLAWLHRRHNNVAFHGLNAAELTDKVFEHYLMRDWKSALSGPDPDISYLCQHKESEHNLLHRHWERLGWLYRYEHRADGHTLWLGDDTTSGMPIAGASASMPFQHQAGSMEDDGVHGWSPVRRIGSARTTLASFNFKHPRVLRADRSSLNRQDDVPQFEIYENAGAYAFKDSDGGDAARLQQRAAGDPRRADGRGGRPARRGNPYRRLWPRESAVPLGPAGRLPTFCDTIASVRRSIWGAGIFGGSGFSPPFKAAQANLPAW